PARLQSFDLAFARAHVFYTEASESRCTAALLLEVDPVGLVRGRRREDAFGLDQYVNDRPYVASSFLSVAIAHVFSNALAGRSTERPALAATPIPLSARVAAVPCRGGEAFLRRLFEPLGYAVTATGAPLDARFPEWGPGRCFTVTLEATTRLAELLAHLYVLIPVLDDDKHYWVGDDEVEKLLRHGEGWLADHPEKEEIVRRYLKHRRSLARDALDRLVGDEGPETDDEEGEEERPRLADQRLGTVLAAVKSLAPESVIDLGCGEGSLLQALLDERLIARVAGMDVSHRFLERASRRLRLDRMPPLQRERVTLLHGSLTYRDARLEGYDVATLVEVVEHLDPSRLAAFERVVFEFARPRGVVLTTPNAEHNVRFEGLAAGAFRHRDHRFEWTRAQFRAWGDAVAARFGYVVRYVPVGPEDPSVGPPSQMAVFTR
ncbi:MAG: 3' terminal RNA ribose 2'-O-methyltransferase Hen1, partial [Planctomycetota bacterium]